jgi:hypothetical protein
VPLLSRKRLILIKDETTYGTDSSPAGANAVLVTNLDITPMQSDVVSRNLLRSYLGASEQLLANTRVQVTFSVEMAGSGTAGTAPRYAPALKSCGMSETTVTTTITYAPISTAFTASTIYYNIDGVLHKVTGCRGTFEISCQVGQIPTINFTMTGIFNGPTDTALVAASYGAQATPVVFKASSVTGFQFFSLANLCLQSFSFNMNNTIVYRELVNCNKEVIITDRAASGSVLIEAPTMATKNFFTEALTDGNLGNLTFTVGTVAGNKVQFNSTRVDITDPTYQDQDGIHMLNIPATFVPSTTAGDEMTLVYT